MILPAPAKINLFLHILRKRCDAMHDLQTAFQLMDYSDTLRFKKRCDGKIVVHCNTDISPQQNIVTRAAQLLREHTGIALGAEITVDKKIPTGAGLGGGSSDAATTLHGLNHLWGSGCSDDDLLKLALHLGADVPLFVAGNSAWGEGVGERLTAIDLPPRFFAVFVPDVEVSTATMFKSLKSFYQGPTLHPQHYQMGDGINQFQEMLLQHYPRIANAMQDLSHNATRIRLSGTGSAFFAICDDPESARALTESVGGDGMESFVAAGLNRSPLHHALQGLTSA